MTDNHSRQMPYVNNPGVHPDAPSGGGGRGHFRAARAPGALGRMLASPQPVADLMKDTALRVIIVEPDLTRLTDTTREAARKAVESELNQVKEGFKVTFQKSIDAATAEGFVVYLMPKSDAGWALMRAKKHVTIEPRDEEKTKKAILAQLSNEGGANVPVGEKSVSFVATDQYERELTGPRSEEERTTWEQHVGQQMAKLILHELGHAMGAEHSKKGLMEPTIHIDSDPAGPMPHFTEPDKKKMRERLKSHLRKTSK